MKVNEIFYSLSGEGVHTGVPTVFVRLTGCNLRCAYCDTQYAFREGEELTSLQVVERVRALKEHGRSALITGGEPLLQLGCMGELVFLLRTPSRLIEIETNGSIDPPSWFSLVDSWSVDVKCPSSGSAFGTFRTVWLRRMRKQDQLKFVVGTAEDLDFVRGFLQGSRFRPTVLLSPMSGVLLDKKQGTIEEYWNREWLCECAEFCKELDVRLSLQLHKIIYGNRKGV